MVSTTRTAIAWGTAVLLTIGLTSCASDLGSDNSGDGQSLTVGSQTGFVNQVVAQLYGQALDSRGYDVDYNPGVGTRKTFLASLQDGSIDVIPDFAGSLLSTVSASSDATSTEAIMDSLPIALDSLELTVLDAAPATKTRAFVVTKAFAEAHSITTIADLAPIAPATTIGSAEQMELSAYGRDALEYTYNISGWMYRSEPDAKTVVEDLLDNTIQVADLSTIDPAIEDEDLVVLKDPDGLITAQNVVPIVSDAVLTTDITVILNAVSAELSNHDLGQFASDHSRLPATVAHDWLIAHDLIVDADS